MMLLVRLATLMLATVVVGPAAAATLKTSITKDGRIVLSIAGEITPGDADAFKAAVKAANDGGKLVSSIRLNSPGGNLLEGATLAGLIRFGKIATNVGQGATCASACFLIFAAGDTKFANFNAQVGVHGASDESGAETIQSNAATVSMARISKELGVPPAIIGRMVVTPPNEMVWLSPSDLQSMGVSMVGKPAQLAIAPPQTSLGPSAGPPMQLQQQQAKAASEPPSWSKLVSGAMQLSSQQNGGTPKVLRTCQPEAKVCNNVLIFKASDGTDAAVLTRDNLDGKTVERELCTFNSFGDVRNCINWDDPSQNHRDMKNSRGEWIKVTD